MRKQQDQRTIEYVQKRQSEGKNHREITRCLKRHIAREIYHLLTNPPATVAGNELRNLRQQTHITLTKAADALRTHATLLSRLERGLYHSHQLATQYQHWLTQQSICKT